MSSTLQHYYLQQMGIEPWSIRPRNTPKLTLEKLAIDVTHCTRCPLHKTRTKTVFSRGNPSADLMIIGEAPGFHEDQQGLAFVGKSGALLEKMLQSVGFSMETVYIANVLKCRPPNNRDPLAEEISQCAGYLSEQLTLVAPKIILAMGRFAGQFLLNTTSPLNKMRNQLHDYQQVPVLVSYHPAYLLRNPIEKKNAYNDLLRVKHLLQGAE